MINLTKFRQNFYDNLEPVGIIINPIENLDSKTNDELDQLGAQLCRDLATLSGFEQEFVNGGHRSTSGSPMNGLICRFDRDARRATTFDDAYNRYNSYNDNDKKTIITCLDSLKKLLENTEVGSDKRNSMLMILNVACEFKCVAGMKEKLNGAIVQMQSTLAGGLSAFYYKAKAQIIDGYLAEKLRNFGESVHMASYAKFKIKDNYGITAEEPGYQFGCPQDILDGIKPMFGQDDTLKRAIDSVCASAMDYVNTLPLPKVKIMTGFKDGEEPRSELHTLLNTNIPGEEGCYIYDLYNTGQGDNGWFVNKKDNFEAILRQQIISSSVNRWEFISDPMMKILAMDSVKNLLVCAEGWNDCKLHYDDDKVNRKYLSIPIKKDFITIDEILESLELVSKEEHKNEIVNNLEAVKTEIALLNLDQTYINEQVNKIDLCITSLNTLTTQQYHENLEQLQIRQEQVQEQIRQEQIRQEQIRQEQIRQEQIRQEQLDSLILDVIIRMYNTCSKDSFKENLWLQYNLLVDQDKKEQFNEKADALYDSFSKIDPTNVEDFRVTLFDEIKAFMLFIAKCVLTVGILPLVEAIKGESVILPSNRECKMRAEKEQTSFVNFVSNNRQGVGVQLS